jgi:hypothetical protein
MDDLNQEVTEELEDLTEEGPASKETKGGLGGPFPDPGFGWTFV